MMNRAPSPFRARMSLVLKESRFLLMTLLLVTATTSLLHFGVVTVAAQAGAAAISANPDSQ